VLHFPVLVTALGAEVSLHAQGWEASENSTRQWVSKAARAVRSMSCGRCRLPAAEEAASMQSEIPMTSRIVAIILGATGVAVTASAGAQDRITIEFYHGAAAKSQAFAVDRGEGFRESTRHSYRFVVEPGAEVCISVANAHPVNYAYSLDAKWTRRRLDCPTSDLS
jgi:hypothetical protein